MGQHRRYGVSSAICVATLLLTGCVIGAGEAPRPPAATGHSTGHSPGLAFVDSPRTAPPPPAAQAPAAQKNAAVPAPPPDRYGNPACPASDAWGKNPTDQGILVTVWSDHPDSVTVLVRTASGVDRAETELIGPHERFQLFEFPDIDHTAVDDVLILTNTRRCYSMMDPATVAG